MRVDHLQNGNLLRGAGMQGAALLLPVAVCAAAYLLHELPALSQISPLMIAILLGILLRNIAKMPPALMSGAGFFVRRALRLGIVLLGIRLTLADIAGLGGATIVIVATCAFSTFFATLWFGRVLGVPRALTELIAAGTSICGASAIVAIHAVRRGPDEDMAYAIATVTILGTLAMVGYPVLGAALGLDAQAFGVWTGATVHEVAQVTAAAYQKGAAAGEIGTLTKLGRVTLIIPLALGISLAMRMNRGREEVEAGPVPKPWFVMGFLAMIVLNSLLEIPETAVTAISSIAEVMLVLGLAAAGLQVRLSSLVTVGLRPFLVALSAWLLIGTLGLSMVTLLL